MNRPSTSICARSPIGASPRSSAPRKALSCKTAVHICYGYGIKANIDWKATLGSQWRQYEEIFPVIARSSIDQVSLECRNSRVPIELLALLKGKDVLVGAIDVASNEIESAEEVADTIRRALAHVAAEKLFPCTNCGMAPMPSRVAYAKLAALAAGAALVRKSVCQGRQGKAMWLQPLFRSRDAQTHPRRGVELSAGIDRTVANAASRPSGDGPHRP